jgi:hypothetical protein
MVEAASSVFYSDTGKPLADGTVGLTKRRNRDVARHRQTFAARRTAVTQQIWLGWKLDAEDRANLLDRFPTRYHTTIADHVTHGPADGSPPVPDADRAVVIGHADDGAGVEALVVEVAGSHQRPDGGTYHITWSLEVGREAHESNDVIAQTGWKDVEDAPSVKLLKAPGP